jgi:hypothetical protein
MDLLGLKDSSREFRLNCVINFIFLSIFNVSCMCPKIRCDGKSKKFYKIFCKLNRARPCSASEHHSSLARDRAACSRWMHTSEATGRRTVVDRTVATANWNSSAPVNLLQPCLAVVNLWAHFIDLCVEVPQHRTLYVVPNTVKMDLYMCSVHEHITHRAMNAHTRIQYKYHAIPPRDIPRSFALQFRTARRAWLSCYFVAY